MKGESPLFIRVFPKQKVTKVKKSPSSEEWKRVIVDKAIEIKQLHGPGNPSDFDAEDEELDIVINRFENILNFSDDDEVVFD